MKEELDAFLKQSQTHAESCSKIAEEMEEIQSKIDDKNRTQSIRLFMAVKERVHVKEKSSQTPCLLPLLDTPASARSLSGTSQLLVRSSITCFRW